MPVDVFSYFLHHRKSISNGVQTPRNFLWISYGPEDHQWARAAPGGVPPLVRPAARAVVVTYGGRGRPARCDTPASVKLIRL